MCEYLYLCSTDCRAAHTRWACIPSSDYSAYGVVASKERKCVIAGSERLGQTVHQISVAENVGTGGCEWDETVVVTEREMCLRRHLARGSSLPRAQARFQHQTFETCARY